MTHRHSDNENIQPPVFILTGPRQGGKTTCLREIRTFLERDGFRLTGFIAHGFVETGNRTGFTLEEIHTGEFTPLCKTTPGKDTTRWGRFYFSPEGIEAGNRALLCDGTFQADLTIVDEVGPFELRGGVWAHLLDEIVHASPRPILWVVREGLVNDVIARWQLTEPLIFTVPVNAFQAADAIAKIVTAWKQFRTKQRE